MFLVNRIVVQFPRYIQDYPAMLRRHIISIPNPVIMPDEKQSCFNSDGRISGDFNILAVGRLCAQKNYEALIEAFSHLSPRYPKWNLIIIGEGEYYNKIAEKITRKKLEKRISLLAPTTSIFNTYQWGSVFCMPSQSEGFPNALAEALAHGLPAVGYAECAGVRDLIDHGKNGLLAEGNGDPVSLASALKTLMDDSKLRKEMGKKARESVCKFHPDKVFARWEDLLGGRIHSRGRR